MQGHTSATVTMQTVNMIYMNLNKRLNLMQFNFACHWCSSQSFVSHEITLTVTLF